METRIYTIPVVYTDGFSETAKPQNIERTAQLNQSLSEGFRITHVTSASIESNNESAIFNTYVLVKE